MAATLLLISFIGSQFNFLTLVYICKFYEFLIVVNLKYCIVKTLNIYAISFIGVLLSMSVPLLYDKYQDQIDEKLYMIHGKTQTHYRKLESDVLRKIPMLANKQKKMEQVSTHYPFMYVFDADSHKLGS